METFYRIAHDENEFGETSTWCCEDCQESLDYENQECIDSESDQDSSCDLCDNTNEID